MGLKRRILKVAAGSLAILIAMGVAYYNFILDWDGRPVCHKNVRSDFWVWMDNQGMDVDSRTNAFPNINGSSSKSLETLQEVRGQSIARLNIYKYVPGLRQDDPADLILMYIDRPTRWVWHGPPPTIFQPKTWLVVAVDSEMHGRPTLRKGEFSECLSSDEFEKRLMATLDFIRTNNRPNWPQIVEEHTRFLNSIRK